MSADLDDLLADRGRGPRTPLDLDAVHQGASRRGRRRRVGAAAGLLTVVVLGAVAVPDLLPDARPPIIDQEPAPAPAPTTTSTPGTGPTEIDGLPVVDPATLGGVVATALTSTDGAGGVRMVLISPDGQREELWLAPGAGPALGAAIVFTPDRRVTLSSSCAILPADGGDPGDDQPCVLTFEPDEPEPQRAQEVGFVIGTDTTGRPLAVAEPLLPTDLHVVDGATSQPVVTLPADQGGLLVSATYDPGTGTTAAIVREPGGPERLMVLDSDGDVAFATSPGDDPATRLGQPIFRDGLVLAPTVDPDGRASLLGFEPGDERPVDSPVPSLPAGSLRGQRVVASSYLPQADVAVLSLVDEATGAPALPLVVRFGAGPDAPTAGATFARLGPVAMDPGLQFTTGPTFLLPADGAEGDQTAVADACADDPELFAEPTSTAGLWFACFAGAPPEVGSGYVRVDRSEVADLGTEDDISVDDLQRVLDVWAEGPTAAEEAAGLTAGTSPEIATIVVTALEDGVATVDVRAGPQVGILSTSAGGEVFEWQVDGALLQFDAVTAVRYLLDGSCESWFGLRQAGDTCLPPSTDGPWALVKR